MNRRGDRAYFHRGLLFAAVGLPERAIGDFSAAIENNPQNVNARIYRSMMYTITGREEQAERATWNRPWPWAPTARNWNSRCMTPGRARGFKADWLLLAIRPHPDPLPEGEGVLFP